MVSSLWINLLTPMFLLNFIIGLAILFKVITRIRKKEEASCLEISYLLFCGLILALCFGSGTSSSLTLHQSAFNFGFITAVILREISNISKPRLRVYCKMSAMSLVLLLVVTSVSVKVVTPYSWWYLTAESYSEARYETDIGYLKGIKLTADEKYVYEDFVDKVDIYLSDDDEIYCYSQISMFYVLSGKVPNVKAPIPWFDVSGSETMLADLEYLKNNKPKMIVFGDHGYEAVNAHGAAFNDGKELGHLKMYEWLLEQSKGSGDYEVKEIYTLHNYQIYLLVLAGS